MNSQDFAELKEAVAEVGLMMRGEVAPSREYVCTGEAPQTPLVTVWALCIQDADDALTPGKVYQGRLSRNGQHIGLTDDNGEHFGCPADWFAILHLPQEVDRTLRTALRLAA